MGPGEKILLGCVGGQIPGKEWDPDGQGWMLGMGIVLLEPDPAGTWEFCAYP